MLTSGSQARSVSAATEGHANVSLSPILWHALDVWQCSKQGYESLHEAMEDLLNCSTEFDTDNWYMSYHVTRNFGRELDLKIWWSATPPKFLAHIILL